MTQTETALQTADVRSAAGLAALEAEWQALAANCTAATVFQTWEGNAAWWKGFGKGGRRLRVVTFREAGGTLVGLAPLMTSFWYATPLRRLSFLGTGTSDYGDILAAPGWEHPVAQSLYTYLENTGGWQIADFQQLRVGSLLRGHLPPADAHLTVLDAPGEACPFLPLPPDWDALLRGLGKKTRANVGYYDRALAKVYEVEIGPVTDEAALDGELTRLFALRLDGETQAALYCFGYGDRVSYYQGGFEPTLARLSLGTVLTARAIGSAIAEGREVFDFLRGDEPYKAKWTGRSHCNLRRIITRPGAFSGLARRAQAVEDAIERQGKAWMRKK